MHLIALSALLAILFPTGLLAADKAPASIPSDCAFGSQNQTEKLDCLAKNIRALDARLTTLEQQSADSVHFKGMYDQTTNHLTPPEAAIPAHAQAAPR